MVTQEQLDRINALARKKRDGEISEDEMSELHDLRRIYIEAVKDSLKANLDRIVWVDEAEN